MQTSRFQLTLTTTLAVGFGMALAMGLTAKDAIGYPAGAAVSMGANPVISLAGTLSGSDSTTALIISGAYPLVITDVVLAASDSYSQCRGNVTFAIGDGSTDLGRFGVGLTNETRTYTSYIPTMVAQLSSGIRVAAGASVELTSDQLYADNCSDEKIEIQYTLTGYYAQP